MFPKGHFRRSEFACPCCGMDTVDAELLAVLQGVRDYFRQPVMITSGYRCPVHNKQVGGKGGSMHLVGKAADIAVGFLSPASIYKHLDKLYPTMYGIGNYKRSTHIDVRATKARW
jgi:uncharacterized protein YcbK (DUF882 family)